MEDSASGNDDIVCIKPNAEPTKKAGIKKKI
jgi:hypothetical protein